MFIKFKPLFTTITSLLILFFGITIPTDGASVVKIKKQGSGWGLYRNDSLYFVKGVGGTQHLDQIASAGGNSVRTWGVDGTLLNTAKQMGLTVTMGIWDPAKETENAVKQYKDNDALLIWALGNEMESRTSDQVALWKQLNTIAEKVKSLDPNHPVMTVIAEIGGSKIKDIKDNFPALDILGINTYGGAANLGSRLASAGWDKPYMVTEFGPLGHWEVGKTTWGVPLEQSSSAKAEFYSTGYTNSVTAKENCLGSYAFLWGNKQEKTHTWYGMFLPNDLGGNRLGAVDAMTFLWTGTWPQNRCPVIGGKGITIDLSLNPGDGQNHYAPGSKIACTVDATDPESAALKVLWDLREDHTLDPATGGASEPANPPISGAVNVATGLTAVILLPQKEGNYRVHVYVYDPLDCAATVNLPVVIDKAVKPPVAVVQEMRLDGVSVAQTGNNCGKRFNLIGRSIVKPGKNAASVEKMVAGVYIRGNKNQPSEVWHKINDLFR